MIKKLTIPITAFLIMVLISCIFMFPLFPSGTIALIDLDGKHFNIFHRNRIGFLEMKTKAGFNGIEKEHEQRGIDGDIIAYKRKFLLRKERKIIWSI